MGGQFSTTEALEEAKAKEAKEKEWRRKRGEEVSDSESEDDTDEKISESESESELESDEDHKSKGAEGLIEIANPNRVQENMEMLTVTGKCKLQFETLLNQAEFE